MEAGVAAIKADIHGSETALRAEVGKSEATLRAEIAEIKADVDRVETALKAEIANVRAELKTGIDLVQAEIGRVEASIGGLEARLYRQSWLVAAGIVGLTVALVKLLSWAPAARSPSGTHQTRKNIRPSPAPHPEPKPACSPRHRSALRQAQGLHRVHTDRQPLERRGATFKRLPLHLDCSASDLFRISASARLAHGGGVEFGIPLA